MKGDVDDDDYSCSVKIALEGIKIRVAKKNKSIALRIFRCLLLLIILNTTVDPVDNLEGMRHRIVP